MRVLQVHNRYRPGWGGEDTVVELETELLQRNGHAVERLSACTKELDGASVLRLATAGLGTVWSRGGYRDMKEAISRFAPHLVHVHNTFPLLSPSVLWAAAAASVPVVHTLHNYRLACANSLLLRDNRPCEKCVGHSPWAGLRYRCFGESFWRTAAVTGMNVAHRWVGTYRNRVHAYIALSEFSKGIFVRAGLPAERIHVKPNFSVDPGKRVALRLPRFVFAGLIARSKGIHLLLEAWTRVAEQGQQLLLIGDGPDRAELEHGYGADRRIVWCGKQPREKVVELIAGSRWLVLPSLAYENFPMTVLEALSAGTPVIVPTHGAFTAMVTNEAEGLLFSAGDVQNLEKALRLALSASDQSWCAWSINARNKYVREYSERRNYALLMEIYRKAQAICHGAANRALPASPGIAAGMSKKFLISREKGDDELFLD